VSVLRRPPWSPLFPYTTLFRSGVRVYASRRAGSRIGVVSFTIDGIHPQEAAHLLDEEADILVRSGHHCCQPLMEHLGLPNGTVRSEEHTSELQSRENLVCRLLL